MMSLNPLLLVGGVIGTVSVLLLIGYGLRAQHGRR